MKKPIEEIRLKDHAVKAFDLYGVWKNFPPNYNQGYIAVPTLKAKLQQKIKIGVTNEQRIIIDSLLDELKECSAPITKAVKEQ